MIFTLTTSHKMAKKRTPPPKNTFPIVEKVFSEKYQCLITKSTAYFDQKEQDWRNELIETNLNRKNR